jgi:site-specific DNA-adenine methylase
MSKYTDLLDRVIEIAEEYRSLQNNKNFSEETREYFRQMADELESIVEDEADV